MRENFVKRQLRAGKAVIGTSLSIPDPFVAEVIGSAGFDFVIVDTEHSPISPAQLQLVLMALRPTQSTVIVRAVANDPAVIKQILDIGAEGVIVPDVSNREECEHAVQAMRYAPDGFRGFGPRRASRLATSRAEYLQRANAEVAAFVMVENEQALDHLDEIVTTPGLDGVIVGPADLATSMGYLLDQGNEAVGRAIDLISQACLRHGVPFGSYTVTPEATGKWLAAGAQIATMGSDVSFLDAGIARAKANITDLVE
jgi:2-keto-3-deoxy-L-rhamnonate aldolase RhmA